MTLRPYWIPDGELIETHGNDNEHPPYRFRINGACVFQLDRQGVAPLWQGEVNFPQWLRALGLV